MPGYLNALDQPGANGSSGGKLVRVSWTLAQVEKHPCRRKNLHSVHQQTTSPECPSAAEGKGLRASRTIGDF